MTYADAKVTAPRASVHHVFLNYTYLQILDFLTTIAFLVHGVREANPFVDDFGAGAESHRGAAGREALGASTRHILLAHEARAVADLHQRHVRHSGGLESDRVDPDIASRKLRVGGRPRY